MLLSEYLVHDRTKDLYSQIRNTILNIGDQQQALMQISLGEVVAQSGKWWLGWESADSVGEVLAQLGKWWLSWGSAGSVGK
jgi:hypothetical protein